MKIYRTIMGSGTRKQVEIMSKKRITYIHIFIWLFAIFANLPYSNFHQWKEPSQIVAYVIGFMYLMLVFYLFYLVFVPSFLNRKKIAEFFVYSFFIVLIMPFFGYTFLFLSRALFEGTFHNFYHNYSVRMHMSGYYPVLTAAVFGSFFGVIINWFKTMNQKAELDRQKLSIELDLLKSKLNPHFLFNTLNNIDSLIHQNSEKASASLIRLSDIMRYLTYETSSDVVELGREVEYINNIIELYRIRIKTPEDIRFEVRGDLNVMISPALYVPLIENAFKYANHRNKKPCIDIQLTANGGVVDFEISNFYDNNFQISSPGLSGSGIINLRKRLDLTYPGKHQLIIEPGDSLYHVKLTINTNAD
jgi:two-component system LytT family sensor kinase